MTRRLAPLAAVALVLSACGGTAATTTTTTMVATTAPTTTVVESTTTSVVAGPLAAMAASPVEDPFNGTGFHQMEVDESGAFLLSVDSIDGPDPEMNRLAVDMLDLPPVTTGVSPDQMLVAVWIHNWSGDVPPSGVALYNPGPDGWELYVNVDTRAVLGFLETTADYGARRPAGYPVPTMNLLTFDWSGSVDFTADVAVFDGAVPDSEPAYVGQVECTLADILSCTLLSDDGVLRLGDTGDDVEALQVTLIALGYLAGPADGVFDDATEDAVRTFQRDYRLTRDGRAGPQTLGLLAGISDGTVVITMADENGIGSVPFGTDSLVAWNALKAILGEPDTETGWYTDLCDGHQWWRSTWDGFTVMFTDRNGSKQLDGWHVDDLNDLPPGLYIRGGLRPGTTWGYVAALGALFNDGYGGFFRLEDLGYNNGRLSVNPPEGVSPAASALVISFGTGTGGFVSC